MDPNFVQGIHDLLQQTLSGDNEKIKTATQRLNQEYYKNPNAIPALANIVASSPDRPIRQMAAVEMRKRVSSNSGQLWLGLPQPEREQIKERFPSLSMNDEDNLVRHSIGRVIAQIASIEFPLGAWPNLLGQLQQSCVGSTSREREIGIYILYSTLENIVEGFDIAQLIHLFERTIADPESIEVRILTVRCLGVIAQYLDTHDKANLTLFQNLLPAMIGVMGQCVENANSEGAGHLFDVLETLLILEVPVLSKSIPELVQFLLQCGGNKEFENELRILGLNALTWTVQYKKSKLQSLVLAPAMLEHLMPITAEEEPEDADEDAPSRSALRIIDTLSTNLPPSQVFPALRELILKYFSSSEGSHRRGAILALGIAVEGCSEFMTPRMSEVWPVIDAALQDGDASVRKAACVAISCFCEWIDEDCAARHAVLVPLIMNLINDPVTQKAACTALDALLEILGGTIEQYLNLIMERLASLLESAPLSVKAVVTGAIGSAAHASKERFVPYFQPTMERIQHFLLLTGEGEEIELRGITMDAIGTFAEAVGADIFRPYFPEMMNQAFGGMQLGSARLRECSFLFFGVMAKVFSSEFSPYLANVVPALIDSCKQSEGNDDNLDADGSFNAGTSTSNAIVVSETDDDGEMELEDVDLDKLLDVNSAIAVEKEIAADTLGTLFTATGNEFSPYVEPSTLVLIDLLEHYYEGIRKSALDSLLEIVRTFYELSNPPDWQPGANQPPVSDNVRKLIGHVIKPILDMYETEDNKSVVSSLCTGFAETINKIGTAFFEGHHEEIRNIVVQVLEQKAYCQQDPDQDDEEEAPEDQAEYDSVLISSAGDVVASLATALGSDFAPAFPEFYRLLAKFYKKKRSLSERSSAIGCLAEVVGGMKAAITPYTEQLFQLFTNALSDEDIEPLSNAAFATGLLIEHSEMDLSAQYGTVLSLLQPLFNVTPDASTGHLNAKDNATGAVARMIIKNASVLPLDQVLPVFVNALPLKNDYLENRPVFRAIFYLFESNSQVLAPYMDHLLQVFATVLDPNGPDQVGQETRAELIRYIGVLNGQDAGKIQQHGLSVYV